MDAQELACRINKKQRADSPYNTLNRSAARESHRLMSDTRRAFASQLLAAWHARRGR
jgi:hypothetical protein